MYRMMFASLAAVSSLALASAAQAEVLRYGAELLPSNESPPNGSAGTGQAFVTFDTVANTMRVQVTYSGLTGNATASHIHCCTATPFALNQTAGVATVTPTFTGFPAAPAGTYDATYDLLALTGTWNNAFITANGGTPASAEAAFLAGIAAGRGYLNIHTAANPGGEIRGFLAPVPEPGTWAMLITGFGALGLMMRRRRALAAA